MSFVDRFLIGRNQILSNDLILSGFELIISQLFSLADELNDIFEFHVFFDFLHISS